MLHKIDIAKEYLHGNAVANRELIIEYVFLLLPRSDMILPPFESRVSARFSVEQAACRLWRS